MATTDYTGLRPHALFADFAVAVTVADLAASIEVPHVTLSPTDEDELRLRACSQRLAVLRKRLELAED